MHGPCWSSVVLQKRIIQGLLTLCVILKAISLSAQTEEKIEALWSASIDFFFDNREYNSKFNRSQTLFGQRLAPELGISFNEFHSIMVGINFLSEFGAHPVVQANDYIAYYQYKSKKFNGYAGLIPRAKSLNKYAYSFFSDSIAYYIPNISGFMVQYHGDQGYVEIGLDWNSMISYTNREKFLFFLGSRFHFGSLYGGLQASMYHHGTTHLDDEIVDNMLLYPYLGVDLTQTTRFDLFDVRVGWMQAFQNVREYIGEYVYPNGFQADICLEKWRFGINNTLYVGQNLMPYWEGLSPNLDYGAGLYWGDPFYRTESMYNRLEFYWQPVIGNRLFFRISSVHHYDGQRWSWQQMVRFMVNMGQNRLVKQR